VDRLQVVELEQISGAAVSCRNLINASGDDTANPLAAA